LSLPGYESDLSQDDRLIFLNNVNPHTVETFQEQRDFQLEVLHLPDVPDTPSLPELINSNPDSTTMLTPKQPNDPD